MNHLTLKPHFYCLIFVLFFSFLATQGAAQESKTNIPDTKRPDAFQIDSLKKTIVTENENLEKLRKHLQEAKQHKKTLDIDLNAFKLQYSTFGNLLLLPRAEVKDLEKALTDNRTSLERIEKTIEAIKKKLEPVTLLRKQTEQHYNLNEKQLGEIEAEKSKDPDAIILLSNLRESLNILSSKQGLLEEIQNIYTDQIIQLQNIEKTFVGQSEKIEKKIREKKKEELFQRKDNLLVLLNLYQTKEEISRLTGQLFSLTSLDVWSTAMRTLWKLGGALLITFCLLFGITLVLLYRLRKFCVDCHELLFFSQYPYRTLAFRLLRRSLPLLGSTLFLYIYAQVQFLFSASPAVRVIINILWTLLITRWFLDFFRILHEKQIITKPVGSRLRVLINFVRWFAVAHLIVEFVIGSTVGILVLARMLFGLYLVVWYLSFLKIYKGSNEQNVAQPSDRFSIIESSVAGFGYMIAGGGLFLELLGYGSLAVYWSVSWGRTATVLLWGGLIFYVLREWFQAFDETNKPKAEEQVVSGNPFRLFLIWMCWLTWLGLLLVSIILAWGGRQTVIVGFFKALHTPLSLGNMRFSVIGFVYASLILLLTHAAVRIWRHIFQNKVLKYSGLEIGLQDSITTITVYTLWVFGILIALHTFGLSTTSLVVAFGALGIGLGFGLQNIFNNFISGIILLFERPIQVGDAVEVNGMFAYVKKINVRATVVQTWDNASLIIPNSEFISSQVTNWSFRDLRLRRNINVGVIYGSDVELVRKTLLEIARNHPKILRRPEPDVLFVDFGDNALIFRLRLWTTVSQFQLVETDIRFEIDHRFQELDIVIAFPQRDIHIKSVVSPIPLETSIENKASQNPPGVNPDDVKAK